MANKWGYHSSIAGTRRYIVYREAVAIGLALFCVLYFTSGIGHILVKWVSVASFVLALGCVIYENSLSRKSNGKGDGSSYVAMAILIMVSLFEIFAYDFFLP